MKKNFLLFMIIISVFFTLGCKGTKQEIDKLAIVMAVGFDLTEENKYMVTVQILNVEKQSSGNGMKAGAQQNLSDTIVYSAEGDTPSAAVAKLSTQLGKKIFFFHSKYTVIGETLAEAGLALQVDAILRGQETRLDLPLFVTKGRAFDIIAATTPEEKIPANSVASLIGQQELMGYSPIVSRVDFGSALENKTLAPILGIININKNKYSTATFEMSGTAVFKKDKLIGFLDTNQTRGMQWIKGKVKAGNIVVPSWKDRAISFEITTASSKIKPILKDNKIMIEINIKEKGNIRELTGDIDPMKEPKIMEELSKVQGKAIENEVKLALKASQKDLKADIFDFGGIIHSDCPEIWKRMEKDWEVIYPDINVEVKIKADLERPGVISKPMK